MELLEIYRLDFLIGLGAITENVIQPGNSILLVRNKEGQLLNIQLHMGALFIVLIHLIWQEEHAITLEESLSEPLIESVGIHRYRNTIHYVPCNHAVK